MGMYGDDRKTKIICEDGRTKQSFARTCNINTLVEKYKATGVFPNVNRRQPVYADVSSVSDYQSSLNVVIEAQEAFKRLPVKVRERFNYDPGQMVAFFEDPANVDEAIKQGWAVKRPAEGSGKAEDAPKGDPKAAGSTEPTSGTGGAPKAS